MVSRRALVGRLAGTLALAGLAGCGGNGGDGDSTSSSSGSASSSVTVEMTDDLTFEPKIAHVAAGGTVTWKNVGVVPHSVTAYGDGIPSDAAYFASGGFESESAAVKAYPEEGALGEDETYSHTFDVPGTYRYYCIPHESAGMKGTIVVEK
ncbi:MAG: plastocyanin/azurin family copper-binding protein [Halarchaeum sp.]